MPAVPGGRAGGEAGVAESGVSARRIKAVIAYDGTEYYGWQVQPQFLTIQAVVERVISKIEGKAVSVAASGRTDAGVHAVAQVASFAIENPIPLPNLKKAMNSLLPPAIRMVSVENVPPAFHPRYDAIAKTYEYRIWRDEVCPPFEWRYTHHYPYPLYEDTMIALAPLLEGDHDFTAFAASDDKDALGRSKVRRIYSSEIRREGAKLIYRVRGSGFLKHMVRNMVGVFLEVGKGNCGRAELLRRLEPGCGIPAGPTAPARGLFLLDVEYAGRPQEHTNPHE